MRGKIRLHQYPAIWKLPSLSPFCIKVETYLQLTGLDYEIVVENNPLKGPRGRMPYIEHGDVIISDSRLIIEYLEKHLDKRLENHTGRSLDHHLTPKQRAISTAFHRLLDQDLIRVVLYSRWVDPRGWSVLSREFKRFFPAGLRTIALRAIRSSLVSEARGIGILEFSRDEIYALGDSHLQTISDYLGGKLYFFGEIPTTVDAALFAFLTTIQETPIDVPLRAALLKRANLVSYTERMRERVEYVADPAEKRSSLPTPAGKTHSPVFGATRACAPKTGECGSDS